MNVIEENTKTLTVSISEEEAKHLLAGLKEDNQTLGDFGSELASQLSVAGVRMPDELDVDHFEVEPRQHQD